MNNLQRELARAHWRTSSYSGSGDQCVEVAALPDGLCAVRDSKDPSGPALILSAKGWRALLGTARTA
ncbi:DUF397 domain-containing protein [Actinomadura keratinilytica]|uniref:DUF397 domain-containing protein n=1 Tax=Actinomadura keratinilytica TaxID=547461 RepID=A0ABP6ULF6_9ACTN